MPHEISNLILDHVFCFCDPPAQREVEIAEQAGFSLTAGVRHQGQGTANRCILFQENYLEFIFVDAPTDVKSDPTHLAARANWLKTSASPFGIGLRGFLSPQDKTKFWEYKPPYWPDASIYVFNAAENLQTLPMIFVIPSAVRPMDRKTVNESLMSHKSRSLAMISVDVVGPSYAWPEIPPVTNVRFSEASKHHMNVFVDGHLEQRLKLNQTLSVANPD